MTGKAGRKNKKL